MNPFLFNNGRFAAIGAIVIIVIGIFAIIWSTNSSTMSNLNAKAGDRVFVHYVGTLENGQEFDNSLKRGQPIDFILGAGQVIKGWDDGILGMEIGQKKRLVIAPENAYGAQDITGAGGNVIIPANSTLVFDVELVNIER